MAERPLLHRISHRSSLDKDYSLQNIQSVKESKKYRDSVLKSEARIQQAKQLQLQLQAFDRIFTSSPEPEDIFKSIKQRKQSGILSVKHRELQVLAPPLSSLGSPVILKARQEQKEQKQLYSFLANKKFNFQKSTQSKLNAEKSVRRGMLDLLKRQEAVSPEAKKPPQHTRTVEEGAQPEPLSSERAIDSPGELQT